MLEIAPHHLSELPVAIHKKNCFNRFMNKGIYPHFYRSLLRTTDSPAVLNKKKFSIHFKNVSTYCIRDFIGVLLLLQYAAEEQLQRTYTDPRYSIKKYHTKSSFGFPNFPVDFLKIFFHTNLFLIIPYKTKQNHPKVDIAIEWYLLFTSGG